MKERDIRPEGLYEEFHIRSKADVLHFFPGNQNREDFSCPGCGERSFSDLYKVNTFPVVKCNICDSGFVTPRPTDEALSLFYREATSQKFLAEVWYPTTGDARLEKLIRPRARLIQQLIESLAIDRNRITDIGAGSGLLLDALREVMPESQFAAVEPNPPFVKHLKSQNYLVFNGLVSEAARDGDWQDTADLVMAFNVCEHVQSPVEFVRDMVAVAKPGGTIMFTGVNGNGFDILTLGANANAICPPQHLNFLSCQGVALLLERCGLEKISVTTPGVLDVDVVKNMLKDKPQSIQDPFLRHVLEKSDHGTLQKFQQFITDNQLSSHMQVTAQKPI